MAEPAAVMQHNGEWFELFNPGAEPVSLQGWTIVSGGGESHAIQDALTIAPATYLVLGLDPSPITNGGVNLDYRYAGISFGLTDSLTLLGHDSNVVDHLEWGSGEPSGLEVRPGRSLERDLSAPGMPWHTAWSPWPGSLGDWGSPGEAGQPPPTLTPTPTGTPLPPTPTSLLPTETATATPPPPTSTPFPSEWPHVDDPSPVVIEEVAYRGDDEEYVVLWNWGRSPVNLGGWLIGDSARPGDGEALALLPDVELQPGAGFIVARDGMAFASRWFQIPDAQFRATSSSALALLPHPDLSGSAFALEDSGDEVVLLTPELELADAVCFAAGECAAVGVQGALQADSGWSLQRVPGVELSPDRDLREVFANAPAEPLRLLSMPEPRSPLQVLLPSGWTAAWGTLGARSTFSEGSHMPPALVTSHAAATGLDFIGFADPLPHPFQSSPASVIWLTSWGWQSGKDEAVIYGGHSGGLDDRWALIPFLRLLSAPAQWMGRDPPPSSDFASIAADDVHSLDDTVALLERWRAAGAPLLPAGNATPGESDSLSPFTGLLTLSADAASLQQALVARRGWLTTAPGLWLTLAAQSSTGTEWMGSTLLPANNVRFEVAAGGGSGAPLSVTLWKNGMQISQTTLANEGQSLVVDLPASPASFYYATAQRSDGAFAVTSPIFVTPNADGPLLINEALAAPDSDLNGDGEENESDEFVELYNPGPLPVSLEGWQLTDVKEMRAGESRFTFSSEHSIPSSGFLVVWRSESHLVLNDDDDHLYLIRPGGGLADEVIWDDAQRDGRSHARTPDGGEWRQDAGSPSPGWSNGSAAAGPIPAAAAEAPIEEVSSAVPAGASSSAVELQPASLSVLQDSRLADDSLDENAASNADAAAAPLAATDPQTLEGVISLPPGLVSGLFYLAPDGSEPSAAPVAIRLPPGFLPLLQAGDRVVLQVRPETGASDPVLVLSQPQDLRRIAEGSLPQALDTATSEIQTALQGRRVRVLGSILAVGDSTLLLADLHRPEAPALSVSLSTAALAPAPQPGEVWKATGYVCCDRESDSGSTRCRLHVPSYDDLTRVMP